MYQRTWALLASTIPISKTNDKYKVIIGKKIGDRIVLKSEYGSEDLDDVVDHIFYPSNYTNVSFIGPSDVIKRIVELLAKYDYEITYSYV